MKNGVVCRILGAGLISVAALILYEAQNLLLIPLEFRDIILDISTLLVVASLVFVAGLGHILYQSQYVFI